MSFDSRMFSHHSHVAIVEPPGVWGSWETDGSFFSGSWGALVTILEDQGSKFFVLGI